MKLVLTHSPADGNETFTLMCFEYESPQKLYNDLKDLVDAFILKRNELDELRFDIYRSTDDYAVAEEAVFIQIIKPYSVFSGTNYLFAGDFIVSTWTFEPNTFEYKFSNPTILELEDWWKQEMSSRILKELEDSYKTDYNSSNEED